MRRVTKIIDALNQVTLFTYDTSGKLLTTTDPLNLTTAMAYHTFDQVISFTYPLSNSTAFDYGAVGNMFTTPTDPLGNRTQ